MHRHEVWAERDQSVPIPACPEWTLRQLVTHVGRAVNVPDRPARARALSLCVTEDRAAQSPC